MSLWQSFLLTFVPLFIVIDALGNLPIVIAMSEGMTPRTRRVLISKAIIAATVVGLVFLFFGNLILGVMGITVGSFAIAGGLILLILSLRYMMTGKMMDFAKEEAMAVVPIGTPLIVGPAAITTLLLFSGQQGMLVVLASFILNMVVCWCIFMVGDRLAGIIGKSGLKAISRIFDLILAAIAVNMIIRGLVLIGVLKVIS